jgi:RNA-directed DNA polymerase
MRARLKETKEGDATAAAPADPRAGKSLRQVVTGFFAYHAVPTNGRTLGAFRYRVRIYGGARFGDAA